MTKVKLLATVFMAALSDPRQRTIKLLILVNLAQIR